MSGRDIHESHRVSTPLELLFDLTFVVAIAAAAGELHHAAAAHHLAQGLLGFGTTFFAIWWAWMTFTWFASAYDTDDTPYRLMTMVQMVGVLVLAAGVPAAAQGDFLTITMGYVVMRVGLVGLWLRAAHDHPERRQTCRRYALGIVLVQVLWVLRLLLPPSTALLSFGALVLAEITIPVWAAKAGHTPWHAHHIAERYGLFTIIVLGECVLGATNAVSGVIAATGWSMNVVLVGFGSASLILALWWVYFLVPSGEALHAHRERAFRWGYGHAIVFLSLAALGAFLGVVADQLEVHPSATTEPPGSGHLVSPTHAVSLVAAAVAVYLLSVWWMSAQVTRVEARLLRVWLGSLLVLGGVVVGVWLGLPLPWAIPALTLAPALVIARIERGVAKRPEHFAIR
jgi:low temperature requirement protein LtrA